MTEVERAYTAGILDGEGWIGIVAEVLNGKDGSRRSHRFGVGVAVSMTDTGAIEYIQRVSGAGCINAERRDGDHKDTNKWRCQRTKVKALLEEVLPYLRVKQRQASLVIRFLELQDWGKANGHKGLALSDVPAALAIYQQVRELNRKGKEEKEIELLEFGVRDGKPRETQCAEFGCEQRRYHKWRWCYTHWLQNRDPETKQCEQCGAAFETRNVLKRYCSDLCQARHSFDVRKGADRERRTAITEEQVKEAIRLLLTGEYNQTDVAKHLGVDRASLGQILRGRSRKEWKLDLPTKEQLAEGHVIWRKKQKLADRQCEQCGETFTPKNPTMRFCGRPCYWKAENARRRAARLEAREG